ncbi:hypothetical protein BCR41DRAFT_208194 [Lobosporangium transversale]|uniref:Uncharacterized protein n=1 Tax=Lobosporangium transversale TaxID=64571 RepID=A0A1Y2G813_9FUNG|nr:hypothetical protein BCR41DRAFT_208194 [Lobosporangium transversale]ORZ02024.1 hypothetical protein BCR41DRAFT_208194 [Lobosporangium transversale]|eukprot:XP_021876252.1 hypothetical protein BCR41DRAFT_208194 [Lobosporangium transversale]
MKKDWKERKVLKNFFFFQQLKTFILISLNAPDRNTYGDGANKKKKIKLLCLFRCFVIRN